MTEVAKNQELIRVDTPKRSMARRRGSPRGTPPHALPHVAGASGYLRYRGGTTVAGSFEIRRVDDTQVCLRFGHPFDGRASDELEGRVDAPESFLATLPQGRFRIDGKLIPVKVETGTDGTWVEYLCDHIEVSREQWETVGGTARFRLTNLIFSGLTGTQRTLPNGGFSWTRDTISLNVSGYDITLVQTPDHRAVATRLRDGGGVAVTCELVVAVRNDQEYQQVTSVVTNVCYLLTLAAGNLVTWTTREIRSADGEVILAEARSAVTRSYKGWSLIDLRSGREIKDFIESTYQQFLTRSEQFELQRVIHARVDVASAGFLETRTIVAGAVAEYLASRFWSLNAAAPDRPVVSAARKAILDSLCNAIARAAEDDETIAGSAVLAEAISRLRYLDAPSANDRLKYMSEVLRTGISAEDLKSFKLTRNRLAHNMKFETEEPTREHAATVNVLDRLLLRLLGYTGPYISAETHDRVTFVNVA